MKLVTGEKHDSLWLICAWLWLVHFGMAFNEMTAKPDGLKTRAAMPVYSLSSRALYLLLAGIGATQAETQYIPGVEPGA